MRSLHLPVSDIVTKKSRQLITKFGLGLIIMGPSVKPMFWAGKTQMAIYMLSEKHRKNIMQKKGHFMNPSCPLFFLYGHAILLLEFLEVFASYGHKDF
jgi:hypothetical protein